MIISRDKYNKLVSHNKNLTKELYELKSQIKYLTVTNDEYYKGAIKWRSMYIKMRDEKKDNEEIKSPIVEQRDAEIEALKHMLERTEVENKDLKTVVGALNKDNYVSKDLELIEEIGKQRQTINIMRDSYTKVEQQREDYKTQLHNLQKENVNLTEELNACQQKLSYLRDVFETNLELAELHHNYSKAIMWKAFLKEVE